MYRRCASCRQARKSWGTGPTLAGSSHYSFDHAAQQYPGHYVEFTDGTGGYRTIPFRYVWPSELDLMAQLAGLRLREPLERVEPRALHDRQPLARLGLGEACRLMQAGRGQARPDHRASSVTFPVRR